MAILPMIRWKWRGGSIQVSVLIQETRKGKGNALACGFATARGDIIVMLDADGSADATEIPRFVEALLHGADFAKGSRFIADGGSSDITRFRRFGNWFFTTLVNVLFGTRYSDLCYGYNAFWVHCLPRLNVDCDGFEVETLINIRVAKAKLRVQEVPSYEGVRLHGVSNLNAFRDGRRVLKTIMRERLIHTARPLVQTMTPVVQPIPFDGESEPSASVRAAGAGQ